MRRSSSAISWPRALDLEKHVVPLLSFSGSGTPGAGCRYRPCGRPCRLLFRSACRPLRSASVIFSPSVSGLTMYITSYVLFATFYLLSVATSSHLDEVRSQLNLAIAASMPSRNDRLVPRRLPLQYLSQPFRGRLSKNSRARNSLASAIGCSGWMPIRSRMNSCVLKQSMIDLRPFCPPCVPFGRILIVPNGKARSSEITISRSTDRSVFAIRQLTASPLKFMNVCGFASSIDLVFKLRRPISERHSSRLTCVCNSLGKQIDEHEPEVVPRLFVFAAPDFRVRRSASSSRLQLRLALVAAAFSAAGVSSPTTSAQHLPRPAARAQLP